MKEEYQLLLMDYLEGSLRPEDEKKLNALIEQGQLTQEEISRFKDFYRRTALFPVSEPSERLQENFYAALQQEQDKVARSQRWKSWLSSRWFQIQPLQLAYGLVIFLLGMVSGLLLNDQRDYEQEMASMQTELQETQERMVVNLLEQPSATQRLKAVNMSISLPKSDERITEALVEVLNQDTHVNVRLAALDALLYYANQPRVREALIRSIPQQQAPMVQLALAEAMVALEEKRSVEALKELMQQEDLNEMVAQEIRKSILALS